MKESSELNKQLLSAIKDVTADTGNWGEYGGQNSESQIEAANECEKICLQQMIFENHSFLEYAITHQDERAEIVIKQRIKNLEETLKQLNNGK